MIKEDKEIDVIRDRYFKPLSKDGTPEKRLPHLQPIFAHRGKMADEAYDNVMREAMAEIMFDLFSRWTQTQLHEVDLRESLYQNVLALGAIKGKLSEFAMYGNNAPFIMESQTEEEDTTE